jgi:taurine dioxygenase
MEVKPLGPVMGAAVHGVDLSAPLAAAQREAIQQAFDRHLLLVFPSQHIDEPQQIAFSRQFGELQVHVLDQYRHPRYPEIYLLSNVKGEQTTGEHPDKGTLVWHSDLSFQPRPALATILYGLEVPRAGGDTLYANMCAAYDALDASTKRELEPLQAVHDLDASRRRAGEPPMTDKQRAAAPPVEHPVVRTHPRTGRKILYISRHVSHIAGMKRATSDLLMEALMAHATQERFVFRHRWGPRDVVMWDNRCTMHCATPYDAAGERRIIHRTVTLV